MTDWTPHNGGPRPVDPETMVEVLKPDGSQSIRPAGGHKWSAVGAYSLLQPEPNWREIADELAAAAKDMLTKYQPAYHDCIDKGEPPCCLCNAEVALTTYNQAKERGE